MRWVEAVRRGSSDTQNITEARRGFLPGLRNGPMNCRWSLRRPEVLQTFIERLWKDIDTNGGEILGSSELK
jgi:hypothetical protein